MNTGFERMGSRPSKRHAGAATTLLLALLLAGCGGGGGDGGTGTTSQTTTPATTASPTPTTPATPSSPNNPNTPPTAAAPGAASCAALQGTTIEAGTIGLPSGGASVNTATFVTAASAGNANGEFCQLNGVIRRVDPNAADVQFQLNLPTTWNGRALQFGSRDTQGTLIDGQDPIDFTHAAAPLAAGYATFGSDAGYQGNDGNNSPRFALTDEGIENYAGAHIKKTHDAVTPLIRTYYGRAADHAYFAGASAGGREALIAAQRWPGDYDGIIAIAPVLDFTANRMKGIVVGQANYAPGGYLDRDARTLLRNRIIANCDTMDGLADGIINNVEACRSTSAATLASLRCPSGAAGTGCLSDAQIQTVNTVDANLTLPYALANGRSTYEGYNLLAGAHLGLGETPTLASPPNIFANGALYASGDQWFRYFVRRDPAASSAGFDPANPGADQARIVALSAQLDATSPDLSAFRARGGKLILVQGLADAIVSPKSVIAYYNGLAGSVGQSGLDAFMRFYTIPGFGHDTMPFIPSVDVLSALDGWVAQGSAPSTLIATDTDPATGGRQRPVCVYPAWPRYVAGSTAAAGSFACVTQ